ncbi:MAG: PfkB family carbohydrate kinase [Thaumarchaeota archaeon]|nr:PfkB family carbohydrate kinase [Candidatus Calditenuaceae archaeon]MDW8041523.1 PfkB family carbohydrate kinase [Nitrososphaerota archaeon]
MKRFRVAVVGHLVLDEVVVKAGPYSSIGGVPTYAGLSIAALGHEPHAVTVVGADGVAALNGLRDLGVYVDRALTVGTRTTRFRIVYSDDHREMWLLSRAADVPVELLGGEFDAVYLGPVAGEVGPDLLERAKGFTWTLLDPQGLMRRFGEGGKLESLVSVELGALRGIRVIKLSWEEARALGYDHPVGAASEMSRITGSTVAVTMGRAGVVVSDGTSSVKGRIDLEPIDATGAGDVFGGALLVGLMETGDLLEATALGLSASAERVKGMGPRRLDGDAIRRRARELIRNLEVGRS